MEDNLSPKYQRKNPLTKSQSLLWIGQEMDAESPMYNMVLTFEIKGAINENHFQTAFQEVINESEALRTVFYKENGEPVQKVLNQLSYEVETIDFSDSMDSQQEYSNWLNKRTKYIFELDKCLFDCVLIKFSESHFTWYFNQHHLTTDAWSTTVIFNRINERYKLAGKDELIEINELPPYQNYLDFEKDGTNHNEAAVDYWHKKRDQIDEPPVLYNLKAEKSSSESVRINLDLGRDRSEKLRELGLQKGVRSWTPHLTLYNIFLTTLFAYLYRVSGQQRLMVGSPAHNRPTTDFKKTIGIFIEIFPLFTEIAKGETFLSLLEKVQLESNGFLKYAQPGVSMAELNRNFNVFFNYIHASYNAFDGIPVNSEWVHSGHSDPRHQLRLQVHDFDNSGSIQLYFDLNSAVFDAQRQKDLPEHFLKILDAFIENKESSIEKASLLSHEEYQKTVIDFNKNSYELLENKSVLSLFEKQANRTPMNTALVFKDFVMTYGELNNQVNQLARYLQEKNIGIGSRVAIFLKRSPDYVVSVLATLKVGAAFISVPSNYPKERIHFILEDSQASLLIGSEKTLAGSDSLSSKAVSIENLKSIADGFSTGDLAIDIPLDSLAYIIYTSGSTGKPKGVAVGNRALSNYIRWTEDAYIKVPDPAVPLFTTVGFDITINSIFLPLICGGAIHVYQENDTGMDLSVLEVVEDNKVDYIKLSPAHMNFLKGKKYPESKIGVMSVIGEELKTELASEIYDAFNGKLEIYNEYGPAEATIGCSFHLFSPDLKSSGVPIGKPIPNLQIYILDKNKNPVPQGVVGELYLAGIGLADGYWERPKLTKEKFVPNPFVPGTKMYRAGDLARLNEDGLLVFLGRTDFQVKINGHRIEIGEIETCITGYNSVDSTTVLLDERAGLKSLIAYFTAKEPINIAELQSYLKQKLPHYMVPSHFKQLEEFPLSSNGKVDRKALQKINVEKIESVSEPVAPQTEIEELIGEIWKEVLGVAKISVHDNFLELGGESLMALRATSRMNEALELDISLDQIFKTPTISKLSAHIEKTIMDLLNSAETVSK